MAKTLDSDHMPDLDGIPATASLLSSDQQLLAGIRVTRAQFAKMMGCSRQAVTEWVRAGRVTVGSDGRFDPRQAVASLLRTGDPARLRAKVLQPLADELASYRVRIVELESALGESLRQVATLRADLAEALENADFQEGAADEYSDMFDALVTQLPTIWPDLSKLPGNAGADVVIDWMDRALAFGVGGAGAILTHDNRDCEEGL